MDDRQAFLESIRANPTDNLPRLVYADWLDEHGENHHAELIRIQLHLPQIPLGPTLTIAQESKHEIGIGKNGRWLKGPWCLKIRQDCYLNFTSQFPKGETPLSMPFTIEVTRTSKPTKLLFAKGVVATDIRGKGAQHLDFTNVTELHVELTRKDPDEYRQERILLKEREKEILSKHWLELLGLADLNLIIDQSRIVNSHFKDGFLERLNLMWEDWKLYGKYIAERHPYFTANIDFYTPLKEKELIAERKKWPHVEFVFTPLLRPYSEYRRYRRILTSPQYGAPYAPIIHEDVQFPERDEGV